MFATSTQSFPREQQHKRTAALIYATIFLVLTTTAFTFLSEFFESYLIKTGRFDPLRDFVAYWPFTQSFFCFLQLGAIFFCARTWRERAASKVYLELKEGAVASNVASGALTGLAALLAAAPLLLRGRPTELASFFLDHLNPKTAFALLIVLVVFLPIVSEAFFRSIYFAEMVEATTLIPSLLLSALLFAWTWPVFSPLVAMIFGIASALLFYRSRSLLACIVANAFLTLGGAILEVHHALQ